MNDVMHQLALPMDDLLEETRARLVAAPERAVLSPAYPGRARHDARPAPRAVLPTVGRATGRRRTLG